ncbi:hypothetical protein RB653_005260 [Dictyostelium firmibasis]|uniref:DOCKER domain-containing protein n=1 Tax=Dictyostelium firmibasis TaxID=79012 RepID=A0AAN7U7F4_9MYCE
MIEINSNNKNMKNSNIGDEDDGGGGSKNSITSQSSTIVVSSYPHSPPNTPKVYYGNGSNNKKQRQHIQGEFDYYDEEEEETEEEEESDIATQNRLFLNPNYKQHQRSRSITVSGSPTPRNYNCTQNQRYSDDTVLLKSSNSISSTATTLSVGSYESPCQLLSSSSGSNNNGGIFSPISVTPTASPLNTPVSSHTLQSVTLTLSPFSIQKRSATTQLPSSTTTTTTTTSSTITDQHLLTPPATPQTPQQKVFSPPRRRNTCANLTNKLYSVYSPHKSPPTHQMDNNNQVIVNSPISLSLSSQKYLTNHHQHHQSVSLSDYLCNKTSTDSDDNNSNHDEDDKNNYLAVTAIKTTKNNSNNGMNLLNKIKSKLKEQQFKHYETIFSAYNESYRTMKEGGISVLNGEVLVCIFQHLDIKEICCLAQTCSWWRIVSEQNVLWLRKFNDRFQRPKTIIDRFSPNESWKELYIQHYFLDTSYMEFERLLSLFPVTVEYELDITILLSKVLNYLKHTECRSEYIDKLEHLKNIHLTFGNKIEAANCYIKHSELISWDSNQYFQQEFGYPRESHSDRKERILKAAIHLLFESKYWERCLILINQLRKKYKKELKKQNSIINLNNHYDNINDNNDNNNKNNNENNNSSSGSNNINDNNSSDNDNNNNNNIIGNNNNNNKNNNNNSNNNSINSSNNINNISNNISIKNLLVLKMIEISKLEHQCYQSIESKERFFEEYFFVEFRGKGSFPKSVDGKDFIFRGKELEKLGSFVSRLKNRYPGAQVIPKQQGVDLSQANGQFIHIRPCKPVLLPKELIGSSCNNSNSNNNNNNNNNNGINGYSNKTHYKTLKSYINNNSKVFFFSAPFKKSINNNNNSDSNNNEFLMLWTRDTYIISKSIFPSLIRNSMIGEIVEIEKNPLENAIVSLKRKNGELDKIFNQCKKSMQWNSHLTMSLNGVVDAVVAGGINMYRMFFQQSYLDSNPITHLDLLIKLKQLLLNQKSLLEFGLDIHSHLCPDNMKALQQNMELCFEKWKQTVNELIIPTTKQNSSLSSLNSENKDKEELTEIYDKHVKQLSRSHSDLESILKQLEENTSGSTCTTPTKQQPTSSTPSSPLSTINQIQNQLNQNQIEQLLKLQTERSKEREREKERKKEMESLALLASLELESSINENIFEMANNNTNRNSGRLTSNKPPIQIKSITTPIKQQPTQEQQQQILPIQPQRPSSSLSNSSSSIVSNTLSIPRPSSSLSNSSPCLSNSPPKLSLTKSSINPSPQKKPTSPKSQNKTISNKVSPSSTSSLSSSTSTITALKTTTSNTASSSTSKQTPTKSSNNYLKPPSTARPSTISRSFTTISTPPPTSKSSTTTTTTTTSTTTINKLNVTTPTKNRPVIGSNTTFVTPKKESLPIPITPVSTKKSSSSLPSSSVSSTTTTVSSSSHSSFTRPTQSTLARKLEVESKKSTTLRIKSKDRPTIIEPKTPQAKKQFIVPTTPTTSSSSSKKSIGPTTTSSSFKKSLYEISDSSPISPTMSTTSSSSLSSSSSYSSSTMSSSYSSRSSGGIKTSSLSSNSHMFGVGSGIQLKNGNSSKLSPSTFNPNMIQMKSSSPSPSTTSTTTTPSPPLSTINLNTNSIPSLDISKPIEKPQPIATKKRLSITDSIKSVVNLLNVDDTKKIKTSTFKSSSVSINTSVSSSFKPLQKKKI